MRKIVIGLMLLLPMLFVLAVFSSVKTVSLGIPVSADGIQISKRPESGTLSFDLSEYQNDYSLSAHVTPEGARNRDYFYRVEGECVSVDESGRIIANKTGEARIFAVSKDGGFEDSVKICVYASKPYGFDLSLYPLGREEPVALGQEGETLFASVSTGRYRYKIQTFPEGVFFDEKPTLKSGFAEIGRESILFPFSGRTELRISVMGRREGKDVLFEKTLSLELSPSRTASGIVVNGGNNALAIDRESESVSFFVEGEDVSIPQSAEFKESALEEIAAGQFRATIAFNDDKRDFSFGIAGRDGALEEVSVTFAEFDFSVRSNLPVQTGENAEVLLHAPVLFYALPSVAARDITYEWTEEGGATLSVGEDSAECLFTAKERGEYLLTVRAKKRGVPLDIYKKEIKIEAVEKIIAAQFAIDTERGLSKELAVGGRRWEGDRLVENTPTLPLLCYGENGETFGAQMNFSSSDETVARIENGILIPVGKGRVKVTAEWAGNPSFGTHIFTTVTLFVVKDAVEVKNSPELFRTEGMNVPIVIADDILLGTNESGEPLSAAEREQMLKEMKSTYNTQFYASRGKEAKVRYVYEFCGTVYGNGHVLNAGLFSAEKDGSGAPRFFKGPLDFVSFGELASVAAQDNICFLVRTDGIAIENLTLLGAGDEILQSEEGYDLSALNCIGTTLEINASAQILNCRVRNGRTVVRVFGGNRAGENYFAETLGDLNDRAERERIQVTLSGCILSQGREFVLKIGANAALSSNETTRSPALCDREGREYPLKARDLYKDAEFYERYVFTDVTLKDSVLERSGFFTVGMESNFSGELLQKGGTESAINFEGWNGTGGTSFASVLRLEGDVRLYDWKELKLIDSSTLIKTDLPELKLDIASMLGYVSGKETERYGEILDDGYVHGGIAFYGGGKNYSGLDTENLVPERAAFGRYDVNISVLEGAEGTTGYLGRILPSAAGTEDFCFYLYGKSGPLSRAALESEEADGKKYEGISRVSYV